MKKRIWIFIVAAVVILVGIFLIVYPTIEIQTEDELIAFRYTDDMEEFETQIALNESYAYYEERDISWNTLDVQKFLFFYVIRMGYIEGNYCDTEFVLEESYIDAFLERAEIEYNECNIDLAALIDGKEAIVGNTRYLGNPYDKQIDYTLDGRHETLFVFEKDDLLVIQVGLSDEGPRYIAYK